MTGREKNARLTVEQKVRAALALLREERGALPVSISEICRLADVSRAGLYQHYPDLLSEIRNGWRASATRQTGNRKREGTRANTDEMKKTMKALLYVCLELQLEVRSLKVRQSPARTKRKSGASTPNGGA